MVAVVWSVCTKWSSVRGSNLADGGWIHLNASQPITMHPREWMWNIRQERNADDRSSFFPLYRCPPWTSWLWSAPSCTAWPTIPTPPHSNQGADLTLPARHIHRLLHTDIQWACKGGAKWAWAGCSILNSRYVNKLKCCIFVHVCVWPWLMNESALDAAPLQILSLVF